MEDLKAYLESGILELYVIGDLSPNEKLEVESMLEKHPQLRTELRQIEQTLETYALKHEVQPKDDLRTKILNSLDYSTETETPIIPMRSESSRNIYKYGFAASVALLLLSLVALINLYSQLKESKNTIVALQESNEKFSSRVNYVEKELQISKQSLAIFHNPDEYKVVLLNGTLQAPAAKMLVAFNSQKQEVMIDMAALDMPTNDEEHQYQLWALVGGKPVDLGVFDAKSQKAGMLKMKSVRNPDAFAVTLEPRGGSIVPTMDQMMAMGNI